MSGLDITKHKIHLSNILLRVYKDSLLSSSLAFKGGTAAMMFYQLPRFSVDLDFDLVGIADPTKVAKRVNRLVADTFEVVDQSAKYHTLFWLLSYGSGLSKIKLEINMRDVSLNTYEMKPYYGVNVKVMGRADMVAHKLVTILERKKLANRDLFDAHYFLSGEEADQINTRIIEQRTGMTASEFFERLIFYIKEVDNKKILNGLGEVLTEGQKDWVKAKLLVELVGLLTRARDQYLS